MGYGLAIENGIADEEKPTWVLREDFNELKNASDLCGLNETDSRRLIELTTLIKVRSQMES